MMPGFKINNTRVGDYLSPYIIAEVGVNHEGSFDQAIQLIDDAIEGGAHAVKFQSYKADKIAVKQSPAYWDTSKEESTSQYELFLKYDKFGEKEYQALANYCEKKGVDFMSTPFDLGAVEFLSPLVPAFKIASADITNVPLIRRCSSQNKPIILSTGASTLPEIEFAVQTARSAGAVDIALLHCVLNYPTPDEQAHIGNIRKLINVFPDCVVGYSDHVVPDESLSSLEVGVLLGASILEKHFTHDKSLPGNDHYHAMDKDDLRRFCRKLDKYKKLFGAADLDLQNQGMARIHARRSIVAARDIKKGEVITEDVLIAKRPAHGISPVYWDDVIGMVARQAILEDTVISWEMLRNL